MGAVFQVDAVDELFSTTPSTSQIVDEAVGVEDLDLLLKLATEPRLEAVADPSINVSTLSLLLLLLWLEAASAVIRISGMLEAPSRRSSDEVDE